MREEQLRIQALGAAISRRDWHAAEQAHAAIRDEFDGRAAPPAPVEAVGKVTDTMVAAAMKSWFGDDYNGRVPGVSAEIDQGSFGEMRKAVEAALSTLSPAPVPSDVAGLVERLGSGKFYRRYRLGHTDEWNYVETGDAERAASALSAMAAERDAANARAEGQWTGWIKADVEKRQAEAERDTAIAERDNHKRRGDNHAETLRGVRKWIRQNDLDRALLWISDGLSGYTDTAENTLCEAIVRAEKAERTLQLYSGDVISAQLEADREHNRAVEAEAERDRLAAALKRIADINLGPDKASGEWRCMEAEAIAKTALTGAAPAAGGVREFTYRTGKGDFHTGRHIPAPSGLPEWVTVKIVDEPATTAPVDAGPSDEEIVQALQDLCDAWESEDGGTYKGNVTNAHKAAREVLRAHVTNDVEAVPVIPGVDVQVIVAARTDGHSWKQQPEWLWYDDDKMSLSLGRWPKCQGAAGYVRLDIVLAIAARAAAKRGA